MRRREGKPVKFSTDKDIPQSQCNKLLLDEMSKQIRKSKIIQKLYIRYLSTLGVVVAVMVQDLKIKKKH